MVNITQVGLTSTGYYSGAGRSNIFPVPSYQKQDVHELDHRIKHSPTEPPYMYNHTGRLYPDLTANGWWYAVEIGGQINGIGGTSASTPVTAGILALLNDALVRAGKSRLGWFHPLLYSRDHAVRGTLKDIWQGGSFGCTPLTSPNDYGVQYVGTKARTGYDASSGLGSPRFKLLREALGV